MSSGTGQNRDQIPTGFPRTEEEAKRQILAFRSLDPFPGISPALLNSADIFDYARETGMVFPFIKRRLKSASYSISIGDQIIYWDEKGDQINKRLDLYEPFHVPKNSIVFIKTEEIFLLPFYIAMRFNLKIDKVHKGVLLGTGPLVDPGFEGHLLIPLHNLTTNDYYFYRGQDFVWVEFTKTSLNKKWIGVTSQTRSGEYIEFPERKKWLTSTEYLNDAHEGEVRSSLPPVLESVRQLTRRARIVSIATLLGVVAILVAVFIGGADILQGVNGRVDTTNDRLDAFLAAGTRVEAIAQDLRSTGKRFGSHAREVNSRTNELGKSIDELREEIQQLRQEVTRLQKAAAKGSRRSVHP